MGKAFYLSWVVAMQRPSDRDSRGIKNASGMTAMYPSIAAPHSIPAAVILPLLLALAVRIHLLPVISLVLVIALIHKTEALS